MQFPHRVMPPPSESASWRKNINLFLASQFLTGITSMVVQYSIIWYLTQKTNSATVLSVATLLGMLPMVFLSPFIGGFVDRLNKKMLLIVPDVVAAIAAVVLSAVGTAAGTFPLWLVFVSLLVRSIAQTFQMPTIQSIIPAMVPREEITKVNGQLGMVQSANFIVAPALGAFLYTFIPINFLLLADVLGALVGVGMLMFIWIPEAGSRVFAAAGMKQQAGESVNPVSPDSSVQVFDDAKFGLRKLRENKGIWYVTLIGTLFTLLFMPAVSMYPLMTMSYFHGTVFQAGVVEVVYSVGMLIAGAVIGAFGKWKNRMPLILFSFFGVGIVYGISGLLTGDLRGFVIFVILNTIGGFVAAFFNILYMAVVQESYPPEELGRVMSVMNSFMNAAGPVGLIFAGPLADSIGVEKLFLIAGIGGIACGFMALTSSRVRNIDRDLHAHQEHQQTAK
ncbi:MAG: MFS transporter [Bifidobacteriaceae bacterium]|jgi:DHA3 family macrolide efflux protein-like MFS transporter|nr:MFS transporter [Bifidobacteriaceae bacterium]MCI1978706.1 MFS transporter [Bifidobacteriaceae bacterium]